MDDATNRHPEFDFDAVMSAAEEPSAEHDSPDADPTPALDASPDDSTTDVETPAEEPTPPAVPETPVIPWDHPDLVALRQQAEADRQEAEQLRQIRATVQASQALRQQQQLNDRIVELSDGDMQRQNELLSVIAQVAQPAQHQAQQSEHRATGAEKMLTAWLLSAESRLSAQDFAAIKSGFDELMQVEGPQVMQKLAYAEQVNAQKYNPQIQALQQKNAELERRLAAAASVAGRRGSGVNTVDRGAPAMTGAESSDRDSFFADLWGS